MQQGHGMEVTERSLKGATVCTNLDHAVRARESSVLQGWPGIVVSRRDIENSEGCSLITLDYHLISIL
jgi:hypothetical protein